MADIKTHLRELGVLVGIENQLNNLGFTYLSISNLDFCRTIDKILPSKKHSLYNNIRSVTLGITERNIIKNAFALSNTIISKFNFKNLISADWFGYQSGKDEPYDIQVNGKYFSLKEESFILENMGLYKLLNCYTGSQYKKRHIFEDYAPTEYCSWFDVTWKSLVTYLKSNNNSWNYNNPNNPSKSGKITLTTNDVILQYSNGSNNVISKLPINCKLCNFKTRTSKYTREEVFSKFINKELDLDANYNIFKKDCAIAASNALASELTKNLNYKAGLPRFLRIHTNSYYYAKTTSSGIELYEVPSLSNYQSMIKIVSVVGSVPNKQANILTTIKNIQTGQILVLRNECRFSHGQFNGTPEAKLYYQNGGSLDIIYKKI